MTRLLKHEPPGMVCPKGRWPDSSNGNDREFGESMTDPKLAAINHDGQVPGRKTAERLDLQTAQGGSGSLVEQKAVLNGNIGDSRHGRVS